MRQGLLQLVIGMILASVVTGCAAPLSAVGSIPSGSELPQTTSKADHTVPVAFSIPDVTQAAAIPPGFISFCVRFPDQCLVTPNAPTKLAMSAATWQILQRVNASVNDAIWPEEDERHYGRAEFWTIPTDGYGDCEDYALTKRKALIDAGLSAAALRIAVVVTPHDARHAVLTVSTDRGDFVLDNLRNDVVAWNATGFTWIERQDPNRAMGWVSLEEPAVLMAANGINIPVAAAPSVKMAVASVEPTGNSTQN